MCRLASAEGIEPAPKGKTTCCHLHGLPGDHLLQETVEGNANRSTVDVPEDFRDWGRQWGQDEQSAQLVMQNQWDNLLRHVMRITAAMEVWEPSTASSSGEDANAIDQNPVNTLEGAAPDRETNGPAPSSGEHPLPPDEIPSRVEQEATDAVSETPTQCSGDTANLTTMKTASEF